MRQKHLFIPDTQIRHTDDLSFISAIGNYIAAKKPDVIVVGGDWADMASLSSYDKGKKEFEGRRYWKDIEAANDAIKLLMDPIITENKRLAKSKKALYSPRRVFLMGNHENRINKAVSAQPELEDILSTDHFDWDFNGFEVHPFLEVVKIDGVCYSHYFTTGVMGRPASTASAILAKKHQSCVAGHQQGRQIATANKADGSTITAIIAGSCYEHNEDYLGPQGNKHWRGVVMLHEVNEGSFDEMFVSISYLKDNYL